MKLQLLRNHLLSELKESFSSNIHLQPQLESASLDVDLILCHVLKKERTWILFNREHELTWQEETEAKDCIERRKTGLPIAYITNRKEFFGLEFYVDENVLIPKPDTELLVEQAILEIKKRQPQNEKIELCDMCCGSGCVGISIACNTENLNMTFADVSSAALKITERNVHELIYNALGIVTERPQQSEDLQQEPDPQGNAQRIHFVQTNLFENLKDKKFHLIVTNPPYVPHDQSLELLLDGRKEPMLALDGDVDMDGKFCGSQDGLSLIRRLVPQCHQHLFEGGCLLMETGEYNAEETARLFEECGFRNVRIEKDLNGMMRDVIGEK